MQIFKFVKEIFNRNASDDNEAKLKEWHSEMKYTLNAIRGMHDPELLSDELKGYDRFNKNKAWNNVRSGIQNRSRNNSGIHFAIRAAAVFLIVLTSSFFIYRSYISAGFSPQNYSSAAEIMSIQLSDGSYVTLDRDSELKESGYRTLVLNGRAYFKVVHNTKNTFTVNTEYGKIEVLGTEFSLWGDGQHTELWISQGRVRFTDKKGQSFLLEAGEFIYSDNEKTLQSSTGRDNYLSWRDQTLRLTDASIEAAMDAIAQHYKTEIILTDNINQTNCRINSVFSKESLDEVLKELSLIIGLEYIRTGNTVSVLKVNC